MSKRLYTLLKCMLQKTFIPSGADLNDYLAPGKYYLGSLGNYTNAPSGYDTYSAYMKVHRQYNPASSNYTEQRLTLGSNYLTFVRRWNGTAWSTWVTYAGSRDLIVAQGTSGKWSYQKYYNGKMEVRYSGYLTFTSGYVTVILPQGWLFLVDTDMAKSPIIIAVERYIGTNRTADFVCNPGSLSYDSTNNRDQFVLYGRATGSQVSGAHYIDIIINGFYK